MPLAHDAIVLAGDAFHGQLALARADKGDLVAGNLMGQHERAEDMAHADGRITRHHKNHMPSPQQAFADPPVLIALDFNGPLIEEIGDHLVWTGLGSAARSGYDLRRLPQQGQAQDDQGPAFHQKLLLAAGVRLARGAIQQPFQAVAAHIPDALAHAFYRDQAVGPGFQIFLPGVLHVHPGQQRAGGAQDDAMLVAARQIAQQVAHLGHNIQAGEAQILVPVKAHACPLADQRDFLAVREHHNVLARSHGARRVNGPLHKRDPGQLFDQLVGDDRVFLDGRDDDAAFFHGFHYL